MIIHINLKFLELFKIHFFLLCFDFALLCFALFCFVFFYFALVYLGLVCFILLFTRNRISISLIHLLEPFERKEKTVKWRIVALSHLVFGTEKDNSLLFSVFSPYFFSCREKRREKKGTIKRFHFLFYILIWFLFNFHFILFYFKFFYFVINSLAA